MRPSSSNLLIEAYLIHILPSFYVLLWIIFISLYFYLKKNRDIIVVFLKEMICLDKIYVFGHQRPDTDAVTSAIVLSYLKNKLGMDTEPRVLGDLNNETAFGFGLF